MDVQRLHACTYILFDRYPGIHHGLCIGDAPVTGIGHRLDVPHEGALGNFERRRRPRVPATLHLFCRDVQLNRVRDCVDRDNIPVFDQRNRATLLCFGYDVPNTETVRSARLSVREVGFPSRARSEMWTHPPLNRPSVKHATSWPSPAPIMRLVGLSISRMPGPPLGPR